MAAGAPKERMQEALARQAALVEQLEAEDEDAPIYVTLLKALIVSLLDPQSLCRPF